LQSAIGENNLGVEEEPAEKLPEISTKLVQVFEDSAELGVNCVEELAQGVSI